MSAENFPKQVARSVNELTSMAGTEGPALINGDAVNGDHHSVYVGPNAISTQVTDSEGNVQKASLGTSRGALGMKMKGASAEVDTPQGHYEAMTARGRIPDKVIVNPLPAAPRLGYTPSGRVEPKTGFESTKVTRVSKQGETYTHEFKDPRYAERARQILKNQAAKKIAESLVVAQSQEDAAA